MPRKIAENLTIKGWNQGLRKRHDNRVELDDLSGPVTETEKFAYIFPGLEGLIYASTVGIDGNSSWLVFFLDGTNGPNYKGELDGCYVLENGETPQVFEKYFNRSFPKIHWKRNLEKMLGRKLPSEDQGEEEDSSEISQEIGNPNNSR